MKQKITQPKTVQHCETNIQIYKHIHKTKTSITSKKEGEREREERERGLVVCVRMTGRQICGWVFVVWLCCFQSYSRR